MFEYEIQKPYKVFISHGKLDSWLAAQIARCARDSGAVTFLDETDISKGDDFKQVIHSEIAQSQELIAIFTPWSIQRFWVWIELGAAWGQGKRVVAVFYGVNVSELEERGGSKTILEDINILDINDLNKYFGELRKRIDGANNE
jgi:TIR domain